MNEQQTVDRVEQLIQESVSAIDPPPQLELFRPSLNRRYCVGATDGGSEDRIIVTRTYYLRGIPKDRIVDVAQLIRTRWQENGHVVTEVNGLDTGEPEVSAQSRPDDFILSLSWTHGDVLGIGVTSTCVWPDTT
ncbi:hypothetical protein [Nonomuraea africana]|uniref:hypothetical protein n=1 Tax=Nonomuraea africana TaxID=46171 RepID=UPI0033EAEB9D